MPAVTTAAAAESDTAYVTENSLTTNPGCAYTEY